MPQVKLGQTPQEKVMQALFGQPRAMTRIGRTPIAQGQPFFPSNIGEFDPITQMIRVRDINDSASVIHEDVHSLLQNSGILDKLAMDDFDAFKMFSTNQSLTRTKLIDEILAEGLTRGQMENKQDLIRRVDKRASTDKEKDLVRNLQRIAKSSEALKTFNSLKTQIQKESNETSR